MAQEGGGRLGVPALGVRRDARRAHGGLHLAVPCDEHVGGGAQAPGRVGGRARGGVAGGVGGVGGRVQTLDAGHLVVEGRAQGADFGVLQLGAGAVPAEGFLLRGELEAEAVHLCRQLREGSLDLRGLRGADGGGLCG